MSLDLFSLHGQLGTLERTLIRSILECIRNTEIKRVVFPAGFIYPEESSLLFECYLLKDKIKCQAFFSFFCLFWSPCFISAQMIVIL